MSITEHVHAVQAGESLSSLVAAACDRAEADTLNAVIRTDRTRALEAAAAVEQRMAQGETLPLAGVPLLVKDNICV